MKKTIRYICLFLALLTCALACACGGEGNGPSSSAPATTQAAEAATTAVPEETKIDRENAFSTIPAGVRFDGEKIRYGYQDGTRYRNDIIGEDGANLVESAVHKRNAAAEDKLGVTIEAIPTGTSNTSAGSAVEKVIQAGDDVYDVDSGHQSVMTKMVVKGYYTNAYDLEYLDFEKPWWAYDYMKEISIGKSAVYFMLGDINLMMLRSGGCVFFNKNMYADIEGSADEFYQDVLKGNWNMEQLSVLSQKAYQDINGNGLADDGDRFGFVATTVKSVDHFQYDAEVIATEFDDTGIPRIIINNERTVSFLETLYDLYYNNAGALIYTADASIDKEMRAAFINGSVLFNPNWFYTAEYLGEMQADYGIIPYPKYDASQEKYRTLVHNGTTVLTVPNTLKEDRYGLVGAFLEEMAYQSYVSMTPQYFELALKSKYSRDSVSGMVLDMLYASFFTNFGYTFSSTLSGLGTLRTPIAEKSRDYASFYKTNIDKAEAGLNDLAEAYRNVQ